MKLLKATFIFTLILSIAACGSDDDSDAICLQSDWVGTYTGTVVCDGTEEDVTVTITANASDMLIIQYEQTGVTTTYDPLPFTGCTLTASATGGGASVTVDATLAGDRLTFNQVVSGTGTTSDCAIVADRD